MPVDTIAKRGQYHQLPPGERFEPVHQLSVPYHQGVCRVRGQAHAKGIKVKTYYTVRELSDYTAEFWALRSLGNEVFSGGRAFAFAESRLAIPDTYSQHLRLVLKAFLPHEWKSFLRFPKGCYQSLH